MKRIKDTANCKMTFLKRAAAAGLLIIFALSAVGCAGASSETSKDDAAQAAPASVPSARSSAYSPAPSSGSANTPEPSPSADPYSYEELTKDIPGNYWDRFMPEIEDVYYYVGQDWDWDNLGWCEYNNEYLITGDQEFVSTLNNPDTLYDALSSGKSRIYEDIFKAELPLSSPIGYYLLGLKHDNDIIKLYSITQLSKYIGTVYEDAAVSGLEEIIEEYSKITQPNQTEEIILMSAQKFKAFLEYDFDYNPGNNEIYGFSEGYIWAPTQQQETPLPIAAWIPQMGTLVDARRIGSKMWVSNGYEIWEIYAYPSTEYTKFNDDGSEFTFLDWDKTVITVSVDDTWNDKMAQYENVISSTSTTGAYEEPYASLAQDYYRLIYRPEQDEISDSSAEKIVGKSQDNTDADVPQTVIDAVKSDAFTEEIAIPFALALDYDTDTFYSADALNESFLISFLWGTLWNEIRNPTLNIKQLNEKNIHENYVYSGANVGNNALTYYFEREPLETRLTEVFGQESLDDLDLNIVFPDGVYHQYDVDGYLDILFDEPEIIAQSSGNIKVVYPAKEELIDGIYDHQFYLTLLLSPSTENKFGLRVLEASWSDRKPEALKSVKKSASSASPSFDENGFIFADSSSRLLTEAEHASLSKEMLGYARNEIFARHGNIFETPKYINHYSQYDWYNQLPKVADVGYPDLNDIEIANVELIKQFEGD